MKLMNRAKIKITNQSIFSRKGSYVMYWIHVCKNLEYTSMMPNFLKSSELMYSYYKYKLQNTDDILVVWYTKIEKKVFCVMLFSVLTCTYNFLKKFSGLVPNTHLPLNTTTLGHLWYTSLQFLVESWGSKSLCANQSSHQLWYQVNTTKYEGRYLLCCLE